jgi:hypothetical protein
MTETDDFALTSPGMYAQMHPKTQGLNSYLQQDMPGNLLPVKNPYPSTSVRALQWQRGWKSGMRKVNELYMQLSQNGSHDRPDSGGSTA